MRRLAFAIAIAWTNIALAEPAADATEAGQIFQRGRDAAKAGRYDEACALFSRSYELEPALGTAVNLADCLERQGHLQRAWQLFDQVARGSQNVQSRARLARARADALAPRLAALTIEVRDPGAAGLAIQLGDRAVTPAPQIRDVIEPGDVALVARVPGRPAFQTTLHAVAGQALHVEIPALAAPPPEVPRPVVMQRRRSRVYLAGGLGLAAVGGLGGSLGVALAARGIYNGAFDHDCTHTAAGPACNAHGKATIDRAGTRADLATGLAIAGGVLAGAAAAVWLTAPREAVQLTPIATGADRGAAFGLGLGLTGRF